MCNMANESWGREESYFEAHYHLWGRYGDGMVLSRRLVRRFIGYIGCILYRSFWAESLVEGERIFVI